MPRPHDLIGIGDFARRVRLTPKQLRDYDENGLLAPAYVDADTGYRYYHRRQARASRRCASEELERDVPRRIAELAAHLGPERFDAEPVTGLYPLDLDGEVAYFVGIAAPAEVPDTVTLPAARVAATTHGGRPSELQLAYFPLIAHVQERGLEAGPQVREIYRPDLTEVLLTVTGGPS